MSESVDYPRLAQRRLSQRGQGRARIAGRASRRAPARPYLPQPRGGTHAQQVQQARTTHVLRQPVAPIVSDETAVSPSVEATATGSGTPESDTPTFLQHELGRLRDQQDRP